MTNGARNAAFESEKSAVALCPSIFLFLNGVPDILMSGFFLHIYQLAQIFPLRIITSCLSIAFMLSLKQKTKESMMYKIEFYENQHGESEVWDFLEALRVKSQSSKDARIQYNQIIFYIDLLAKNGTNLPVNITKHLEEDIWELHPGNNRVFYFYYDESQYVLLHHFRKKSQKTPKREIARAKAERNDYIRQKEAKQ